jgi:hypothetical protein
MLQESKEYKHGSGHLIAENMRQGVLVVGGEVGNDETCQVVCMQMVKKIESGEEEGGEERGREERGEERRGRWGGVGGSGYLSRLNWVKDFNAEGMEDSIQVPELDNLPQEVERIREKCTSDC